MLTPSALWSCRPLKSVQVGVVSHATHGTVCPELIFPPRNSLTATYCFVSHDPCRFPLLDLSMNAPVMVDIENETDPLKIAMKELRERKIPIKIRRYLPDGSHEDWAIAELIMD